MSKAIIAKVSFGKYYTYFKIPCIEVKIEYSEPIGDREITNETYYLSAFRGYSFQVSGSYAGEWCLGATPVFGLETLNTVRQTGRSNLSNENTRKYICGAIAMDAVNEMTHYPLIGDPEYEVAWIMPKVYDSVFPYSPDASLEFSKFVDNVLNYVTGAPINEVEYKEEEEM